MNALLQQVRAGRPITAMSVIDMHGHLGRFGFGIPDVTAASLVATMDRTGVDIAVVTHIQTIGGDVRRGNDEVAEAMRTFPGRILGYVVLWPGDGGRTVARETEDRLENGFIGVKLHSGNGFSYTHPAYAPAFEICNERHLPILLHTWGRDGLVDIRRLAETYPDAALLLGHAGVLDEADYIGMARDFEHVYLDPTMSRTPRGLWERLVEAVGPGKLVWGTDALFFSPTPHLAKIAAAQIGEDARRAILWDTPRRILHRGAPRSPAS